MRHRQSYFQETAPFAPPRQRLTRIGELRPRKSRRGSEGHLALWRTRRMQLPGGSTRIPPARVPVSLLVIINGNNIATTTGSKRISSKSSRRGGTGYNNHRSRSSKKRDSSGYRPYNESTFPKKTRHPETRADGRHRVTVQQPQPLASALRRKVRGEE
ncbi:uncharacterized protein LOC116843974 [Odontomachus brunneus]|uniref:uncharacterized protein LOC116843974 n=1 Tax=Odontomachus brunneus TaxID=486640 RepID=UPI0013F27A1C|nr:uncharacterized protein LOC116843974 [Odontomachus brunneus]